MKTQIFIKQDCVHTYDSVPYFTIIPYDEVIKSYSGKKVRLGYDNHFTEVYTESFERSKINMKNKDYIFSSENFGHDRAKTDWLCAFYSPSDKLWNIRWVDRIRHSEFGKTIEIECCFFRIEKPENFLRKSISDSFDLGLNGCTTTFFFNKSQSHKVLNRMKKFYQENDELIKTGYLGD